MTPRERQLAAIRREPTDRISTDALAIENATGVAALLGVPPDGLYDALGIDGRIIAAGYTGAVDPDEAAAGVNVWGAVDVGDYGTSHTFPLAAVSSVRQLEAYRWPDPAQHDFEGAGRAAAELGATYAVRGPYWMPLFCRVCNLFGMEEAMARMLLQPAIFEAALEHVFAFTLEYCERLVTACGDAMPILCLGDDFATQRGMLISPTQWRQFLAPRYARLFAVGKRAGLLVWFHSCGDITQVLPDLLEIGMDVWETVQLHTLPMTAAELKREYGRELAFFGGVNTQQLPFIGPDAVRAQVRELIATLGEGGGYICGPDHHIKPDVPPENVAALYDEARRA